jgi:hypothetical protein
MPRLRLIWADDSYAGQLVTWVNLNKARIVNRT